MSIGLGVKEPANRRILALKAGLYFGLFQALMPLIGYFAGLSVMRWIESYAHWIAFALLMFIGVKMCFEAFGQGVEEEVSRITHRVLLVLAIATSIDALAAGFALNLLPMTPILACILIGLTTLGFSVAGVFVGVRFGAWLESKAHFVGGLVLCAIGVRMLFS